MKKICLLFALFLISFSLQGLETITSLREIEYIEVEDVCDSINGEQYYNAAFNLLEGKEINEKVAGLCYQISYNWMILKCLEYACENVYSDDQIISAYNQSSSENVMLYMEKNFLHKKITSVDQIEETNIDKLCISFDYEPFYLEALELVKGKNINKKAVTICLSISNEGYRFDCLKSIIKFEYSDEQLIKAYNTSTSKGRAEQMNLLSK
jgi:hypothetical protein